MRHLALLFIFLAMCGAAHLSALEEPGKVVDSLKPDTQLGSRVDLNLAFRNSEGQSVTLGQLVQPGKPTVIVPVYYHCPHLCTLVLSAVSTLIEKIGLSLGGDYQIITVSFDSSEGPEQAAKRAAQYRSKLMRPDLDKSAWHFLVGEESNVAALMNQIGFRYLPDRGEFAHSAAIILLTPQGEISQFFTGVDYSTFDVRLALIEASQGNIGTAIDHAILFCFRFDPLKGKYTWAAVGLLRAGGAITLALLLALVIGLLRRERLARQMS